MYEMINGQQVPAEVARGLGHQLVREYAASSKGAYSWPAGSTRLGLPWFARFDQAVQYLESKPYAGYIQTYLLDATGGLSNVTAGCYYRKTGGDMLGPVSSVDAVVKPETEIAARSLAQALGSLSCVSMTRFDRQLEHHVTEVLVPMELAAGWSGDEELLLLVPPLRDSLALARSYDCLNLQVVVLHTDAWRNRSTTNPARD